MKKHFTGIALFIFIVGISGFVASLFNQIPKAGVSEITETVPRYESRTKCFKKYRNIPEYKSKITFATYNEKTGQLYTAFTDEGKFNLYFFVKDGDETRFLAIEKVQSERIDWESVGQFSSFKWLKKLDFHENLYVIAEDSEKAPIFEEDRATAVVIARY